MTERNEIGVIRLDKLCRLVTDGTHDSPKLQESGVPFVKGKHISKGFIDFENCDFITQEDHEKAIRRSKPEKGDTLFSNIGSVGDAAHVYTDREFSIKNVALFKPDSEKVDSRYFYYVVIGPDFRGELMSKRQGVAQPFFSLEMLRSHTVRYHLQRNTQRKIAAILSAYDDLIENNLRRIKILEEMAQNLYREWFVKFRFPGHEKIRFVDSPLGMIPEGWEVATVGDLTTFAGRGISPKYDPQGDFTVVNQRCIRDHRINFDASRAHAGKVNEKKTLHRGDVLINSTGVGTLGRVAQVTTDIDNTTVDSHVSIVRPIEEVSWHYFGMALLNLEEHFAEQGAGATGQTELRRERIQEVTLSKPTISLLDEFSGIIGPLRSLADILSTKNSLLRNTRDLLLPKLVSGELDVSELDIQIPEEVAE